MGYVGYVYFASRIGRGKDLYSTNPAWAVLFGLSLRTTVRKSSSVSRPRLCPPFYSLLLNHRRYPAFPSSLTSSSPRLFGSGIAFLTDRHFTSVCWPKSCLETHWLGICASSVWSWIFRAVEFIHVLPFGSLFPRFKTPIWSCPARSSPSPPDHVLILATP